MIRWFQFVPHARIAAFEAIGWKLKGDAGAHHSVWSVVMVWEGEGNPPQPQ